jgi:hypothetical protein
VGSKRFFDPLSSQLLVPKHLPPNTPFGSTLPLAVEIPAKNKGKGDIYMDDSIFICSEIHDDIEKIAKAVPLFTDTIV